MSFFVLGWITACIISIRGRERYTRLCSRLKDGLCTIRKSFSAGEHDLHVTIEDMAGNTYSEDIGFQVI